MIPYHPNPKFSVRPHNFRRVCEHPLWDGCVFAGLGQLAGSGTYFDSSQFGNHGIGASIDKSKWSIANQKPFLSLTNAGNDGVAVADQGQLSPGFDDFSVVMWMRQNATQAGTFQHFVNKDDGTGNYRYSFRNPAAEVISFTLYDGSTIRESRRIPMTYDWMHISATRTGSILRVFRDGQQYEGDVPGADLNLVSTQPLNIGFRTAPNDRGVNCDFADVFIHNPRAVTNEEMGRLADPTNVMLDGAIEPILTTTYLLPLEPLQPTYPKSKILSSRMIRGVA